MQVPWVAERLDRAKVLLVEGDDAARERVWQLALWLRLPLQLVLVRWVFRTAIDRGSRDLTLLVLSTSARSALIRATAARDRVS
jgi:hypothetical protein